MPFKIFLQDHISLHSWVTSGPKADSVWHGWCVPSSLPHAELCWHRCVCDLTTSYWERRVPSVPRLFDVPLPCMEALAWVSEWVGGWKAPLRLVLTYILQSHQSMDINYCFCILTFIHCTFIHIRDFRYCWYCWKYCYVTVIFPDLRCSRVCM